MQHSEKKETLIDLVDQLMVAAGRIDEAVGEVCPETENALSALERLEVAIPIKIDRMAMVIENYRALAACRAARSKREAARAKSLENVADRLHLYLEHCLRAANIREISTLNFSFRFQKNPARVEIEPNAELPEEYVITKTETRPDKIALFNALKAGEIVSGVTLMQTDRLTY